MGKPRMIIVIRHAQSEGNKDRAIHQTVPDHRVALTPEGWRQAADAGHRLRSMLRPDDTLQFYVSPYRRTRETTEGILSSLTSDTHEPTPFPRAAIKVWEEPRLREQDFGNFQPSSDAMAAMWRERANYGHFFYRIPNGESAADAYDRISGFNETLWRSFSDEDCPSVCVLVTHGLMTRVFLMRWYHWSVEYFEDLRNVNHCEFVVMERGAEGGRYVLHNRLRTWSELKRRAARAERERRGEVVGDEPDDDIPSIATKHWSPAQPLDYGRSSKDIKLPARADTLALGLPPRDGATATPEHTVQHDAQQKPLCAEEDSEAFPRNPSSIKEPNSQPPKRPFPPSLVHTDDNASAAPTPHDSPHLHRDAGFEQAFRVPTLDDDKLDDTQEREWRGESGTRVDALGDLDMERSLTQVEREEAEDRSVEGSIY